MNDLAMEYQSTLYRIEKTLKRLNLAGLNVSHYIELKDKINQECINENKNYTTNIDNFGSAFLINNYSTSISKLHSLELELNQYQVYIEVSSFVAKLKRFLSEKEKDKNELNSLSTTLIRLLQKLKTSNTLDWEVEGSLIESTYYYAFCLIKEEFLLNKTSMLFSILASDSIHVNYLDKVVVKELETINLKDKKYQKLASKKEELDYQENYVDEELFRMLAFTNLDETVIARNVAIIEESLSNYQNDLLAFERQKSKQTKKLKLVKANVQNTISNIKGDIKLFCCSLSLSIGLFGGAYALANIGYEEPQSFEVSSFNEPFDFNKYSHRLTVLNALALLLNVIIEFVLYAATTWWDCWGVYVGIKELIKDIASLKERIKEKEDCEKEYQKLLDRIMAFKAEHEDLFIQAEQELLVLANLPDNMEEKEKLEESLSLIRKINL